jgi:hypothetical protein
MRAVQQRRRRASVEVAGSGTTMSWAQRVRNSRELHAAGELPQVGGRAGYGLPPVRSPAAPRPCECMRALPALQHALTASSRLSPALILFLISTTA